MESTHSRQLAHGVYAALATPRRQSLAEPDDAAFLDYLDIVSRAGVNGLVLFGSTGEFVHFDMDDRMHTLNLAIKRSRVPVLVNVSHSTLDGAVALADDAINKGAAGVLVMPPYFYKYEESDLEEFFFRLARAVDGRIPVYLYNLPQYTNPISPPLLERLLTSGLFAGIKDSSADWELFQHLAHLRGECKFQLLAGNEKIYLRQQLEHGTDGIVSGISAALPELLLGVDRAVQTHNPERARKLDTYVQEFLERIDRLPATIGIKQAASSRGWHLEHFAIPPGSAQSSELTRFRDWLKEWIPMVIEECLRA
ncbi:MAG: dihydrodipicolinate synthase family protein [Bryobacteraceae bacterium]